MLKKMNKLKNYNKISIIMSKIVKLTKLEDTAFDGKHPNGINVDYSIINVLYRKPKVGDYCIVGDLMTSMITEIIDENTFRTKNSIYKIEEIQPNES
jgi:hypothetical protein